MKSNWRYQLNTSNAFLTYYSELADLQDHSVLSLDGPTKNLEAVYWDPYRWEVRRGDFSKSFQLENLNKVSRTKHKYRKRRKEWGRGS